MSAPMLPAHQPTLRDERMVLTLLNGCDPCCWLRDGAPADAYAETAREVVTQLALGGGVVEVLLTLPDAEVEAAHQFAQAALHWWHNRVTLLGPLSA